MLARGDQIQHPGWVPTIWKGTHSTKSWRNLVRGAMSRALDEKPYGLITKEVEVELNIRAGRMVNRNL